MNKKFFFLLLIFCFFVFTLTACEKAKTMILFNNNPITYDNFLENSSEFNVGQKIYYLFITEKQLKTDAIRVRVMKRDSKAKSQITKMIYSNDYRLRKDQVYYYDDYVVMNSPGHYCLVIFSKSDLMSPLAVGDFMVK